jgi:hypothetical protein
MIVNSCSQNYTELCLAAHHSFVSLVRFFREGRSQSFLCVSLSRRLPQLQCGAAEGQIRP